MKMGKERNTNAVTTIGESIQHNNQVMIKIMAFLIVLAMFSLSWASYCTRTVKRMAESATGVEEARNYQNAWVSDAILAITEGVAFENELDPDKCEVAKWYADYNGFKIRRSEVQEAFDKALSLHEEIHQIYKENAGVTIESDPEQAIEVIHSMTLKYEEFSENIDVVTAYYTEREALNYNVAKYQILIALIIFIILGITTPKLIKYYSKILAEKIAEPVNAVANWATELSLGSD